jgi:peptidoglycan/xylan/chitin deacetylase (PgdA/CDA1 family)
MIKRLYPGGKAKAFNITYDDGVLQDVRFVELMNKYGLKGTFNLNSALMETEFAWTHPTGMTVKRLPTTVVAELYQNHEVASHTLTHPYLSQLTEPEVMHQMAQDKENLERLTGKPVLGFAGPFHHWSSMIADCARKCGFEYARNAEERYCYAPPEEYYDWSAGSYHIMPGFRDFVEGFFHTGEELALCQIVGHTYDLDTENMWEYMESILKRVAEDESILSMTNLELVRYLKAMRSAVITEEEIQNSSDQPLWFEKDGEVVCVEPKG